MSLSHTAEYWWDIKNSNYQGYTGKQYYHIPGYECGRKHWNDAIYAEQVNCTECKQALLDGYKYPFKYTKESYEAKQNKMVERKRNSIKDKWKKKYPNNPDCPNCGFVMLERTNSLTGNKFYGCCQYPNCKTTKSI